MALAADYEQVGRLANGQGLVVRFHRVSRTGDAGDHDWNFRIGPADCSKKDELFNRECTPYTDTRPATNQWAAFYQIFWDQAEPNWRELAESALTGAFKKNIIGRGNYGALENDPEVAKRTARGLYKIVTSIPAENSAFAECSGTWISTKIGGCGASFTLGELSSYLPTAEVSISNLPKDDEFGWMIEHKLDRRELFLDQEGKCSEPDFKNPYCDHNLLVFGDYVYDWNHPVQEQAGKPEIHPVRGIVMPVGPVNNKTRELELDKNEALGFDYKVFMFADHGKASHMGTTLLGSIGYIPRSTGDPNPYFSLDPALLKIPRPSSSLINPNGTVIKVYNKFDCSVRSRKRVGSFFDPKLTANPESCPTISFEPDPKFEDPYIPAWLAFIPFGFIEMIRLASQNVKYVMPGVAISDVRAMWYPSNYEIRPKVGPTTPLAGQVTYQDSLLAPPNALVSNAINALPAARRYLIAASVDASKISGDGPPNLLPKDAYFKETRWPLPTGVYAWWESHPQDPRPAPRLGFGGTAAAWDHSKHSPPPIPYIFGGAEVAGNVVNYLVPIAPLRNPAWGNYSVPVKFLSTVDTVPARSTVEWVHLPRPSVRAQLQLGQRNYRYRYSSVATDATWVDSDEPKHSEATCDGSVLNSQIVYGLGLEAKVENVLDPIAYNWKIGGVEHSLQAKTFVEADSAHRFIRKHIPGKHTLRLHVKDTTAGGSLEDATAVYDDASEWIPPVRVEFDLPHVYFAKASGKENNWSGEFPPKTQAAPWMSHCTKELSGYTTRTFRHFSVTARWAQHNGGSFTNSNKPLPKAACPAYTWEVQTRVAGTNWVDLPVLKTASPTPTNGPVNKFGLGAPTTATLHKAGRAPIQPFLLPASTGVPKPLYLDAKDKTLGYFLSNHDATLNLRSDSEARQFRFKVRIREGYGRNAESPWVPAQNWTVLDNNGNVSLEPFISAAAVCAQRIANTVTVRSVRPPIPVVDPALWTRLAMPGQKIVLPRWATRKLGPHVISPGQIFSRITDGEAMMRAAGRTP